jgi:hypothetical protein
MERFTRLSPKTPKREKTTSTPTSPAGLTEVNSELTTIVPPSRERKGLNPDTRVLVRPRRTTESSNVEPSDSTVRDSFSGFESEASSNNTSSLLLSTTPEDLPALPSTPTSSAQKPELASLVLQQTPRRAGLKPATDRGPRLPLIKMFGLKTVERSDAIEIPHINEDDRDFSSSSASETLRTEPKYRTDGIVAFVNPDGESDDDFHPHRPGKSLDGTTFRRINYHSLRPLARLPARDYRNIHLR